jgi:RES domain-containing protein
VRVWRIAPAAHAAFDGEGTRRFGSRWVPRGLAAVHTSGTLSLAALELFVHTDPDLLPADLVARHADVPEAATITTVDPEELPGEWREFPPPASLQRIGGEWLRHAATAILSVPSVIVPSERNFVLNPAHVDLAKVQAGPTEPFEFDARMWTRSRRARPRRS